MARGLRGLGSVRYLTCMSELVRASDFDGDGEVKCERDEDGKEARKREGVNDESW